MAETGLKMMGRNPNGTAESVTTDGKRNMGMALRGSLVDKITFEPTINSTDSSILSLSSKGFSGDDYTTFKFLVTNTLKDSEGNDVPISRFEINLYDLTPTWFWDGEKWINDFHDAVPVHRGTPHLMNSMYPTLDNILAGSDFRIIVQTSKIPVSGEFTLNILASRI